MPTIRFGHMADVHLGAFRDSRLREMNLEAFKRALSICRDEKVDFIVIAGDLFHTTIPDMGIVKRAVDAMRELRDAGIRIYVIYGSHDYSATGTSLIDVLEGTGLFKKVLKVGGDGGKGEREDRVKLEFIVDEPTGTKLTGVSGRKATLEKANYEALDVEGLEKEQGFKIFVLHSAITEFRPSFVPEDQSIPMSMLPKGFDYYAAGHIHRKSHNKMPDGAPIVYPGPLMGYDYRDLEEAETEKRGFFIVEWDGRAISMDFKAVQERAVRVIDIDADGKTARQVTEVIAAKVNLVGAEDKVKGSIVLLKVSGELASGKPSDVDIAAAEDALMGAGAEVVLPNRNRLTTKEHGKVTIAASTRAEIEAKVFEERLKVLNIEDKGLKGKDGIALAKRLTPIVVEEQGARKKEQYETDIVKAASSLLEVDLE